MTPPVAPPFGKTLLLAMGFALVLEGLFYALFAGSMPDVFKRMAETPVARIRRLGIIVACAGLLWMVWVRATWFD